MVWGVNLTGTGRLEVGCVELSWIHGGPTQLLQLHTNCTIPVNHVAGVTVPGHQVVSCFICGMCLRTSEQLARATSRSQLLQGVGALGKVQGQTTRERDEGVITRDWHGQRQLQGLRHQ
jgi:hypothetical protein